MTLNIHTIPRSIYHGTLSSWSAYHAFSPWPEARSALAGILRGTAEALVVSPHVTFGVSAENRPLLFLLDFFGYEVARELLRERAIRFLCQTSAVQLSTTGPGSLHPLGLEAEIISHADRDPERLAALAFADRPGVALAQQVPELIRLAADVTEFTNKRAAADAAELARTALDQPEFAFQGRVISDYAPDQVPDQHRRWAIQLAQNILDASVFREYELDFFEEGAGWDSLRNVLNSVRGPDFVVDATERILRLERVPSIPALLERQLIRPSDVFRLRDSEATEQFRRWLWSQPDPSSGHDILQRYAAQMVTGETNLQDSGAFRTVKVTFMKLVGTLIETFVTGHAQQMGADPAAAENTGRGARLGMSVVGEFLIDRIMRPSEPRQFADKLRRLEVERSQLVVAGPRLYE